MSNPRHPGSAVERLPGDIEALLEAERHAPPPPNAVESRIRARVAGTLAAAGGIGTAGSASATAATASSGAGAAAATATAAKAGLLAVASAKSALLVLAVSVAATTGGVVLHHRSRMERRSSETTIVAASAPGPRFERRAPPLIPPPAAAPPAAAPVVAAPPVELSRPSVVEARPAPLKRDLGTLHGASVERAAAATEPSIEPSRVGDENRLLATALDALGRNAPSQALDALGEHARRFPHGLLEEEREALWIRALVARGDTDAARARAEEFRTRFPGSIQNRMISSALATIPR